MLERRQPDLDVRAPHAQPNAGPSDGGAVTRCIVRDVRHAVDALIQPWELDRPGGVDPGRVTRGLLGG